MHCFQKEYVQHAVSHPCITLGLKVKQHVHSDVVRQSALADDVADMLQCFLVPDLPWPLQLSVTWLRRGCEICCYSTLHLHAASFWRMWVPEPVCNLGSAHVSTGACSKQAFTTHKRHRLQHVEAMQQHFADAPHRKLCEKTCAEHDVLITSGRDEDVA